MRPNQILVLWVHVLNLPENSTINEGNISQYVR